MEARSQVSPMTLACGAMAGAAIMYAGWFASLVLPRSYFRHALPDPCGCAGIRWSAFLSPMLFGPLALIVGGGVLWWLAERRLESGLRTETWQDEELKPLRRVVNRSGFKLIGLLPFAIWLILLVANYRGGLGGLSIIFIQPFLAIARVGALLNPKPTVVRQDWHEWKRFQSEHWGEGQVPGEEFLSS